MKIVINNCFGGFSLSNKGVVEYFRRKGIKLYYYVNQYRVDHSYKWSDDPKDKSSYRELTEEEFVSLKRKQGETKTEISTRLHANAYRNPIDEWTIPEEHPHWGLQGDLVNSREIARDDPILIALVEELGHEIDGDHALLKIVELPDDVTDWYINEYDGLEDVHEGRTWS